jgi:glycine/D-amino acid oxidase-like deaminating enzyme
MRSHSNWRSTGVSAESRNVAGGTYAVEPVWALAGGGVTCPTLTEDVEADVAIVGAGFTGLWAAYYLLAADPSLRVVILEREHAGFGASGRNGGWCSAIFPVALEKVAAMTSHDAALRLQHAMNDTVDEVGRVSAAEGIDCHYDKSGNIALARSQSQLSRARKALTAAAEFGLPKQTQFVSPAEARSMVNATDVLGGLYTEHCGVIHPRLLVQGLLDAVRRRGAKVYERTAVQRIGDKRAITARGTVTADVIVRATEAYTPQLPGFERVVVPIYSLVVATEPLAPEVRAEIGFERRTAFTDLRHLRIYGQPTADGRIVFGGRGAPYHFRSKVDPSFDSEADTHRRIMTTLLGMFPALAQTRITHAWGGPLGLPRDWHPSVGYDRKSGIAWAGPYVGDGVATSNLAGRILRALILGTDDDVIDLPLVNHHSPQWEPEPLRWFGINAGIRIASVGDIEERLTGRPSKVAGALARITGGH